MEITEVRIFPSESKDGKLKAFATMTFDDWFVVRNVKIIQGNNGLFVAMPSRKAMDSCNKCGTKNARGSKFCNQCGTSLPAKSSDAQEGERRTNEHMDVAHPITQECRVYIQEKVLEAFNNEKGKQEKEGSGYTSPSTNDINEADEALQKKDEEKVSEEVSEEAKDIEL